MTQSPVTVTYSLEEILSDIKQNIKEVNQKLDNLQKDVNDIRQKDLVDLKVGQVRLETELVGTKAEFKTEITGIKAEFKTEITGLREDIKEIKGSQKAQIWTLIGVLGTAVLGTVIRFVITALPGNP